MAKLQLLDETDVQTAFAAYLRQLREAEGLSRQALSVRSNVPAPTIKKFELTGQISFRQLLLLWQSLDELQRIYALTQAANHSNAQGEPKTIEEVLKGGI